MQFVGARPAPVRVQSDEFGAGVAMNHTINVDHGDDFEDEVVEKVFGSLGFLGQKVNNAFEHESGRNLTGMLPGNDPN